MSLRSRLLAACAAAATLPVALLALVFVADASGRLESELEGRLERAIEAFTLELERAAARAAARLEQLPATLDGPGPSPEVLARLDDLDVLEVVGDDGRRLFSLHWPAGTGLPDDDARVAGRPALRFETTTEGFGSARRLCVAAERRVRLSAGNATARAGFWVDDARLGEISSLVGVELGVLAEPVGGWIAGDGSPLRDAAGAGVAATEGRLSLRGRSWQYASRPLGPDVLVVAAAPRSPLEARLGRLRVLALGATAVALLVGLLASSLVASQLARPLRALTGGVTGVARADPTRQIASQRSDELGELARTFDEMTTALRASETRLRQTERVAAWREMARRLAHELKNPLFPIQISIESLARAFERAGDSTPQELRTLVRESTGTLLRELRGLRATVDAFAGFAKTPPPAPRPTDLRELVEHVLAVQRPASSRLVLAAEIPAGLPRARVDPDQVSRAVTNLVLNAVAVSPDGGRVTLRARTEGSADVVLEVADEGPGLDPEEQSRVFAPYHTTRGGGTGLGLAIVQAVASDHGGRVEVESRKGGGATFRLVLPVAGPAPAGAGSDRTIPR